MHLILETDTKFDNDNQKIITTTQTSIQ